MSKPADDFKGQSFPPDHKYDGAITNLCRADQVIHINGYRIECYDFKKETEVFIDGMKTKPGTTYAEAFFVCANAPRKERSNYE